MIKKWSLLKYHLAASPLILMGYSETLLLPTFPLRTNFVCFFASCLIWYFPNFCVLHWTWVGYDSFCPRQTVFVGDYVIAVMRCLLLLLFVRLFKTFSYLLNQTSEVHETLPVLFLCQWELVYQFSEKFINFYYPLPIIFVVIFYWT